jgi:hypothetical protein
MPTLSFTIELLCERRPAILAERFVAHADRHSGSWIESPRPEVACLVSGGPTPIEVVNSNQPPHPQLLSFQ